MIFYNTNNEDNNDNNNNNNLFIYKAQVSDLKTIQKRYTAEKKCYYTVVTKILSKY